jgi:hypothetical protein
MHSRHAAVRALDYNPHHHGVSALEIHSAVGPAWHADNVEVVTNRSDFEQRILVVHLTSKSWEGCHILEGSLKISKFDTDSDRQPGLGARRNALDSGRH